MPNYKQLYTELAQDLSELGCLVADFDWLGYCFKIEKKDRAFIVISSELSIKNRYLTLCHEVGHLFYFKNKRPLNWSKKPRTEEQANEFAIKLLKLNKVDTMEYTVFYSKAAKRKLKKCWIDLLDFCS